MLSRKRSSQAAVAGAGAVGRTDIEVWMKGNFLLSTQHLNPIACLLPFQARSFAEKKKEHHRTSTPHSQAELFIYSPSLMEANLKAVIW